MKKNQWLCGRLIQINPLKRQVNLAKIMETFNFGRYIITKLLKGGYSYVLKEPGGLNEHIGLTKFKKI